MWTKTGREMLFQMRSRFVVMILFWLLVSACQSHGEPAPACKGQELYWLTGPLVSEYFRWSFPQLVWLNEGQQIAFQLNPSKIYLADMTQAPDRVSLSTVRYFPSTEAHLLTGGLGDSSRLFYTMEQDSRNDWIHVMAFDLVTQTETELSNGQLVLVAPDGRQLFFYYEGDLHIMNLADGSTKQMNKPDAWPVAWHPDGTRVAYEDMRDQRIHILDLQDDTAKRITTSDYCESSAAWSADGELLAYIATYEDNLDIFAIGDIGDTPVKLTHLDRTVYRRVYGFAWHPTQKQMVIVVEERGDSSGSNQTDLYLLDVETGEMKQLTQTPFIDESFPHWSPQGDQLAFAAHEGGTGFVDVLNLVTGERVRLTSVARWR